MEYQTAPKRRRVNQKRSPELTETMFESLLFHRLTSVYTIPCDVASSVCATLQELLGPVIARKLASENWFVDLERWVTFATQVPRAVPEETVVPQLVASGVLREVLFAVARVARVARVQLALAVHVDTTDAQALDALVAAGWRHVVASGDGNNCLADAILQLLFHHNVIHAPSSGRPLSSVARREACRENRKRLCLDEHLHPRDVRGHPDNNADLQHDVHANRTSQFFIDEYGATTILPQQGIRLFVHTRYDA